MRNGIQGKSLFYHLPTLTEHDGFYAELMSEVVFVKINTFFVQCLEETHYEVNGTLVNVPIEI